MDTPAARLEKKFKRKHRLIESDIGKPEKAALQRLLKEGRVVRLRAYYLAGYEPTLQSENEYFIHRDHLAKMLDSSDTRSAKSAETYGDGDNRKRLTGRIHKAYEYLTRDKGRRSVFISDLQRVSETGWEELRGWIEQEIVEKGQGQLDEGDWGAATAEQRAAAVELWGRKRLYIALEP